MYNQDKGKCPDFEDDMKLSNNYFHLMYYDVGNKAHIRITDDTIWTLLEKYLILGSLYKQAKCCTKV